MFGAGGGTSSYREVPRRRTSSSCGARTRARRTRSSSTTLLKAVHRGAKLIVVDPRRTASAQWADLWLGLDVGTRHRARERDRARDHRRRPRERRSSSTRATTGFEAYRESVEPYTLDEAERVTGVPADAIRELAHAYATARARADLLDARHHRAPQRRRQRLRADRPRPADRPRRPLRLRPQPAARPEQRPGRRRHGRAAEPAARLPATSRTTPRARASTQAWGVTVPPKRGLHLTGMFEAMEHGELTALLRRSARTRPSPRPTRRAAIAAPLRPRPPRRAGHLPHEDRGARRRRPARRRDVVRDRGHGDVERAARAARAQGARPARRGARRPRRSSSTLAQPPRARPRAARARRTCGTSSAGSRRHTRA